MSDVINMDKPVIEFLDVALNREQGYDCALRIESLRLGAGELALVHVDPHARMTPLADGAEGLLEPASGRVLFLGADWRALTPDDGAARMARIGRVFCGASWLSNLDVDENITLRERHHTRRGLDEIREEAAVLAGEFGFSELPGQRPAWLGRDELARAQWVRAFMGHPALLLLEFPEVGVEKARLPALAAALGRARSGGAAAIWITSDPAIWGDDGLKATGKYQILNDNCKRVDTSS